MVGYFLILAIYIGTVYGLNERYSILSGGSLYLFEIIFIALSMLYFWKRGLAQQLVSKLSGSDSLLLGANLILGFVTFHGAKLVGATVPFNINSLSICLMLVVVAPILEELIFRHALFIPLQKLLKSTPLVILITSLIFSYSHFRAFFGGSGAIRTFVIYQSVYTFLIALLWGFYRIKRKSLVLAMLMHAAFNLGFGIAAILTKS